MRAGICLGSPVRPGTRASIHGRSGRAGWSRGGGVRILQKMLVVPEKARIWKIGEAGLEYEFRASANLSLKQIRAVFACGLRAHSGLILKSA